MRAWLWVFASMSGLMGCGVNTSIVREEAAADFDCPPQAVDVRYENQVFHVSGCELRASYVCTRGKYTPSRCRPIGQRGVPAAKRESIVRAKAAAMLECDPGTLAVVSTGAGGRYVAKGCERRIEYECITRGDCCAFTRPGVQPLDDDAPRPELEVEAGGSKGSLSKARIRSVIDASIGEVRACYEAALRADWAPNPTGIVTIQFVIASDGHVEAAAVLSSSLGLPEVEACIAQATKRLRFDEPDNGGIVVVTYPYVLQLDPPGPALECP